MNKFTKFSFIITFILVILAFNKEELYAQENENNLFETNTIVLQSDAEEEIVIYEDDEAKKSLITVENGTLALLISEETDHEVARISTLNEQGEEVVGYVNRNYITYPVQEPSDEISDGIELEVDANIEMERIQSEKSPITGIEPEEKATVIPEVDTEISTAGPMLMTVQSNQTRLRGIALKSSTHVYSDTNKNSPKLKSYNIGSELIYRPHNGSWYKATVYLNGKAHTGYIHKEDVDNFVANKGETLYSHGIKQPTHVFGSPSVNSNILKSYNYGHKLKFQAFSDNWYMATVYISGKPYTGYISKADLSNNIPSVRQGYAQSKYTNVYQSTSKSSKVLRSYLGGQLLKYRPYNDSWHIVTVYLNGVANVGYIHKDDIGNSINSLYGYAQLNPTNVYQSTSKSSKVLRSYLGGHLLKYAPNNSNWYQATVYLNGKPHTGYIHKNDVGTNMPPLNGYSQSEPTNVYQSTSKTSGIIKGYRAGVLLKYRYFNNDWYRATVLVNGQTRTGYIHKNDVGAQFPTLHGLVLNSSISVYNSTSRSSKVLKTYRKDSVLKYRPHNGSWYKATVYVNGKPHTGYIHHNDVITLTGKSVVVDAGHGGSDPGALGNGLREKDINLDIATRVQNLLRQSGINVIMTRTNDTTLSLADRSSFANSSNADLFVSIHTNAGGGQGIETWWYSKGPEPQKSKVLAEQVQKEVINETKTHNRGIKEKDLHVNRETNMPSALIEVGFIDNKNDAEKLKNSNYREQVARGISNGIKLFFQIFS